ncbi:sulfotransferase 6b1-like [Nannochloropsis oceanica]
MPKPIPQVREEREGGGDDGVLVVGTADSNKQKEEVDDEDEEEKAEPCYLYLVRDGRDVCVSFYHHLKSMASDDGGYQGEFADFFEEWIEGRLPYGRWMDHVVSWLAREGGREGEEEEEEGKRKEHDSNYEKEGERKGRVLVVRYEDLKKDLMGGLKRIAKHCRISLRTRGREGAREGEVEKSTGDMKKGQEGARTKEEEEKKEEEEDRMWETVKEKCSFEYMVENRKMFEPRSVTWTDPAFRFIRKGEVGDHKVHFTEEQLRRFAGSVKEWFGEEGGGGEGERRRAPVHVTQMLESWEGFLDV